MVEFLYDTKSKSYKIIEVNPRAWGSIMLSEFSGSKFITNYIHASMNEELEKISVKKDSYIRWIFPWDVINYLKQMGNIQNFWSLEKETTCYINITYSSFRRSTLYHMFNIFDPTKIKKLYRKVFKL